jgi:hypothetical protein
VTVEEVGEALGAAPVDAPIQGWSPSSSLTGSRPTAVLSLNRVVTKWNHAPREISF